MNTAPHLMDMLSALIATPSVSSVDPKLDMGNRAVTDLLANWLNDLKFDVQIFPVGDYPEKANLVARIGGGADGLVLSGHTDTVPYDVHRWSFDPFKLTEADQRLYGLGMSDMKAFMALAIEAVKNINRDKLKQALVIQATADEESTMLGAKHLLEHSQRSGRYVLIGEPTGLKPVRKHKGVFMEGIRLLGQSGHSSNPSLGNSALEGMHEVITSLLQFRNELQQKYRDDSFEMPFPSLNLGAIHGGDNPNRICGECALSIDMRPLPGMDISALRSQIRQRVSTVAQHRGLTCEFELLFDGIPAMETPPDAELVQMTERFTGQQSGTVAFGTEAPFFQSMGMEVVILGPGDVAQAHQPDEYLRSDRIQPTIELLTNVIRHFCM